MGSKININGQSYSFTKGQTILDVCRANNIEVPTLCFLKDINEVGSCRVCVVEVKGRAFTIVGGTKDLNTIQFTKFMNQVQADVATEFGITLPLPADRHYSDFINEYLHQ